MVKNEKQSYEIMKNNNFKCNDNIFDIMILNYDNHRSLMKTTEVKFRHYLITRILKPFIWLYFKIVYKLKYNVPKVHKEDGPFVVIGNHTVNPDPIIMGLSFRFHLYYIASEQIFNLGFVSKVLKYLVNPIKKSKSVSDIVTIRKIKKITRELGSIGIFPEGNTTYDGVTVSIPLSTAKLIKALKLPVIILNTKGMYFTNPRWAVYRKKGKTEINLRTILKAEDYIDLTDEKLHHLLNEYLQVDAYKDQETKKVQFKGSHIAVGLERLIFMDLDRNIPFVTYTVGNKLKSTVSDFELTYQTNGYVLTNKGETKTLVELNCEVKLAYFNYYLNMPFQQLFVENVEIIESFSTKKISYGRFDINLRKDSIYFIDQKGQTITWHFDHIVNIAIQGKRQVIVYLEDATYLIKLNIPSSPYKYLLTYQYYNHIKLGGYHINEQLSEFGL